MSTTSSSTVTLIVPTMSGGGTERAILMLANYWAKEGLSVRLVLFQQVGVLLPSLHPEIKVHSLETKNPLLQIWRLRRYLNECQTASVLSALNPANLVAVLAVRFCAHPVRVVASVHNHLGAKYKHVPSVLNPLRKWVIGRVLTMADQVICVSQAIADFVITELQVSTDRVSVIYNPIDYAAIAQLSKVSVESSFLDQAPGPILISAGRLHRQKNFPLLIRAFAMLPEEMRLVILGEGEERTALESLVADLGLSGRVLLPGFQDNPIAWFKRADCYVMTSDWEGFPFVLLEALAVGLAVVSTDCMSGPSELLAGRNDSALIACENAEAIAQATLALVARCKAGRSLSLDSRIQGYEIERISKLYQQVL